MRTLPHRLPKYSGFTRKKILLINMTEHTHVSDLLSSMNLPFGHH